jgi:transketolase
VSIAVAAAGLLASDGLATAVVSMPCMELFDEQAPTVQQQILGDAPRLAVEASIGQSWHRWLRPGDRFVGMPGFGASGPGAALYDHFGITAARLRDDARQMVTPPIALHHTTGA